MTEQQIRKASEAVIRARLNQIVEVFRRRCLSPKPRYQDVGYALAGEAVWLASELKARRVIAGQQDKGRA